VALPVLLEHDFKATFGVITGKVGTGKNFWRYMDDKELKELASHGMEIASHTETHPHLTDNLADEQLHAEITGSKLYLEQMGFEVETFIYPYYEWDNRILEFVKDAGYSFARGGWPEEGSFRTILFNDKFKYHLPSQQITGQDMKEFKSIVNKPVSHSAICLVYHFISDDGPKKTSTPVANFRAQMAYLKEAGFNVVLLPELFP
jgi:peptidoglycan/xylan/chitin deacetylase (PgdA/CDA1 family)